MPGPLSRFALAFLALSFALIMAMLWFLNHLPAAPKGRAAGTVHPQVTPAR